MANKYKPGDVHAPVEDTNVPLGLKVLVIVMFMLLVIAAVALGVTLNQIGLLRLI